MLCSDGAGVLRAAAEAFTILRGHQRFRGQDFTNRRRPLQDRRVRSQQTDAGIDPPQDHSRRAQMKTLLIMAIGATFATTAAGQTPASPDDKAKQEMVKSATESTMKGA